VIELAPGLVFWPGYVDRGQQEELLRLVVSAASEAPYFTPLMPRTGRPFSVRMTNFGSLGWVSDRSGYRYQTLHPETGRPWPPLPQTLLSLWQAVSAYPHPPEACLVNFYRGGAKMGLHQDADEQDFAAPVVSLSLGDTAVFRFGGTKRGGPTRTLKLSSGDILVMGGSARLIHHGIDRILANTCTLLSDGGRINLTLRRVRRPPAPACS
jgi:alkylated DNA repair protein (DNA oxidative demethylase)